MRTLNNCRYIKEYGNPGVEKLGDGSYACRGFGTSKFNDEPCTYCKRCNLLYSNVEDNKRVWVKFEGDQKYHWVKVYRDREGTDILPDDKATEELCILEDYRKFKNYQRSLNPTGNSTRFYLVEGPNLINDYVYHATYAHKCDLCTEKSCRYNYSQVCVARSHVHIYKESLDYNLHFYLGKDKKFHLRHDIYRTLEDVYKQYEGKEVDFFGETCDMTQE